MKRVTAMALAGVVMISAAAVVYGVAVVEEPKDEEAAPQGTQKNVYARWENGPLGDASYFPIGVWAQNPRSAGKYKEIGINLYLSLHGGPTEKQLADLKRHGMKTICAQNEAGLKFKNDPTIIGWMHGDEPDNYKKNEAGKYVRGPQPDKIIADYKRIRKNDPSRPVLLNLGQGVANDEWKGGWAKAADYKELVKGCDIVSYDIYPACSTKPNVAGNLYLVAKGVDRLISWSKGKKIVWFITECTHIQNPNRMATPHEVRSEVWMALVHGANGIVYFCHQWQPKRDFAAPLNNPEMKAALTAINKQITELAPVLNSPTVQDGATVRSSKKNVPIDIVVKSHGGATYVFAAGMRNGPTKGAFQVKGLQGKAVVEVLGEGRKIDATGGKFADSFKPWDVHLYRITKADQ